jgi:two-component system, sensor histidine kinase YesM
MEFSEKRKHNHMINRLKNYINRSFNRRLLFFFVPYIIVLLVSVSLLCFNSFYNALKQEKEKSTKILVSQASNNLDYYFMDIKTMMAYMSMNKYIFQALTEYDSLSIEGQYNLNNQIADDTRNINVFKSYINDIIIIGKNGYYNNLQNYYRLSSSSDLLDREWLTKYHASENSRFYFTPPHLADYYETVGPKSWVVSSILPIIDQGKTLGYLQGDIDFEKMNNLLDTVFRQNEIALTVVTSDGDIVFDHDINKINSQFNNEIFKDIQGNEGSFINSGIEVSSMIVYQKSTITGWYLIASVPYSTILNPGYSVSITILFIILPISLLLALIIFVFISNQFNKPLSKLMNRIESVDVANYRPEQIDYGVGEIADVGRKFETMLVQINELIKQVYLAEIKKKNAEFESLRKQITPHFMYNSLQVIKAEAIFSKNKRISQIVTSIANLLRYSMDNQTIQVTVADEISYIRDYLEIYKRRFIGKFEYRIEVDEEIMNCKMQKLILQPIVENSIKHGFENLKVGGIIHIRGRRDTSGLIFEVLDNGKGISLEMAEQLRRNFEKADHSTINGIGLFNVHQRILMECGANYGITEIDSKEGEYMRVVLKVKE